jgi:hypothetical protein
MELDIHIAICTTAKWMPGRGFQSKYVKDLPRTILSKCPSTMITPGHLLGRTNSGELTVHIPWHALVYMNWVAPTAQDQWQTMLVCHH